MMTAADNEELIPMLRAIRLTNPQEEEWSESSSSDAFNSPIPNPTPRLPNPSQTPQQRDFPFQPTQYFNPLLNQHSRDRCLFSFPGSSNSQYTSLLSPYSFPEYDHISNPQSSSIFLSQSGPAQHHKSIYHTITHPIESHQLINKVRCLKLTRTSESSREIEGIILALASDPISLRLSACNRNGSYTLKQLINTVQKSCYGIPKLTRALATEFSGIAFDVIGGHVIRECFMTLRIDDTKILCTEMAKHCLRLATDEKGCILLNECLPFMCRACKAPILEQIASNCQLLANDSFGTYVVQEAITRQHKDYTPMIVNNLRGSIVSLSTQKEGSHLVEKCLKYSSTKQIVMEGLRELSSDQLRELASHEFANFVIQQALSPTLGEESARLRELTRMFRQTLSPIIDGLQLNQFGRKVCKKYKATQ